MPKAKNYTTHRDGKFLFSGYWGRWSLLLTANCTSKPGTGQYIEIDLEPSNGFKHGDIDELFRMNVRRHSIKHQSGSRIVKALRPELVEKITEYMGEEFSKFLLDTDPDDIIQMIDFERLNGLGNSASLYYVLKDGMHSKLPQMVFKRDI